MFGYRQFNLGTVPVRISLLWLIAVAGLLVVTINEVIPGTIRESPGNAWIAAISIVVVGSVISVAVHEGAHAIAAAVGSDRLPRLDPAALTALPDVDYFPPTPARDAIVGLAGPGANALLAAILAAVWGILGGGVDSVVVKSVLILSLANAGLALLGLMPGYPFDGARVLRAFVWYVTDNIMTGTKVVAYYGYVLILAGLALGVFMLAAGSIYSVWGVWVLVTIWMCNRAAIAGVTEVFLLNRSASLTVNDVIHGTGRRIPAESSIEDAVEPLLEIHDSAPSLVVEGGSAIGLIDLKAVRSSPRVEWRTRRVREIMRPLASHRRVDTGSSLRDVLESIPPGSDEVVLLERGDRIVGAATREVIIHHLREYLAAERLEELRRS